MAEEKTYSISIIAKNAVGAAFADVRRAFEDTSKSADSLTKQIATTAAGFVSAQAIIGAAKGAWHAVIGEIESSIKAASEAETAHVQLVAALRAQGTAVPTVVKAFGDYATALQNTTIYQDDAIEAAEALLVQVGNVMPRDMEKALTATTNLASGLGIDLTSAAMMVAKAAEGNTTALKKAGITLDETKAKAEGFGYVLDVIGQKFGGQADAIAGTYQGRLAQLSNTWNNVEESIGRVITQNTTVLDAFGLLNQGVAGNTTELNTNRAANELVSGAVIGLVKGFSLLVSTVDLVQTTYQALRIASNEVLAAVANLGITLLDLYAKVAGLGKVLDPAAALAYGAAQKQAADAATWLRGAVQGLHDDSLDAIDSSVKHGNALATLSGKADALAAQLDATRGRTTALKDATDTGTDAWTRHTKALADTAAIKKQAEEQHKLAGELLKVEHGLTAIPEELSKIGRVYDESKLGKMADEVLKIENAWHIANFGFKGMTDGLKAVGTEVVATEDELHNFAGFDFVGPQLPRIKRLTDTIQDAFKDLPQTLYQAFTGGGGVGGALNALGSKIGGDLFSEGGAFASVTASATKGLNKVFGEKIGGMLSAAIPGLGAMIGPALQALWGGIKKLFGGPSAKELEGRSTEGDFEKSMGGWQGIQKALIDAGLTADQTNAKIQALWNSEKQGSGAVKSAIDDINGTLKQHEQDVTNIDTAVGGVTSAAQTFGGVVPQAFRDAIKELATMKGITEDQKTALLGLTNDVKPNFKELEQTAAGYGITLAGLGPAFQQAHIEDTAKGIFNDFDALTKAGANVGGVLYGMREPISKLVQDSLKFGTAIPDNMKPLIDELVRSGNLLDENGRKITDTSKIKFEDTPIDTGFNNLAKAIQGLTDLLTGKNGVAAAIDQVGQHAKGLPTNPFANWKVPHSDGIEVPGFASEAYVRRPTLAIVGDTPGGEFVLKPSTIQKVIDRAAALGAQAAGGAQAVVDLEPLKRELSRMRSDLRTLPATMARAVRDGMLGA